jgi:hypothetical protein
VKYARSKARALFARVVLVALAMGVVLPAHALYDPRPDASLALAQGECVGSLTYRDYQQPDRMVTLPTRLFAALGAPDTLVLHYVFDDGPGNTVFSYESVRFDFARNALTWTTGDADRTGTDYRIVSVDRQPTLTRLVFEGMAKDEGRVRVTIEVEAERLLLRKEEIDASGNALLRNTFAFRRAPLSR